MPLDSSKTINAFLAGYGTGDNYRERLRKQKLADILGQAYDPGISQEQINQTPEMIRAPGIQPTDPSFNFLKIAPELAKGGFAPEAFAMQMQLEAPKREMQKIAFENYLKRQGKKEDLETFRSMFGGGGMGPGTSFEYGPQGPTIKIDPAKARELSMNEAKFWWETGMGPGASGGTRPSGGPMASNAGMGGPSGLPPKQAAELAAKRAEEQPKARQSASDLINRLDVMGSQIKKILGGTEITETPEGRAVTKVDPNLAAATGASYWRGYIPGTGARNVTTDINTLKSQVAFSVLQAMRDASKTGGALGQVSEKELALLENNLAALDQSQTEEAFVENLQRVMEQIEGAKQRANAAYSQTYGESLLGDGQMIPSRQPRLNERRKNVIDFNSLPVTRGR